MNDRLGALSTVAPTDGLSAEERNRVVHGWNAVAPTAPIDDCIHSLFERRAAEAPQATALVFEGVSLSYAELNARANRLANHLIALGVRPEARVAVALERGIEMIVAVLATLKAGGGYVPLDPAYPAARLTHMLTDSAPFVLLTTTQVRAGLPPLPRALPTLALDMASPPWASCSPLDPDRRAMGLAPRHLAYVIYTSGSTGLPKGVMVEHANVVRLFDATQSWYGFGAGDVWTMFHSFAFDFSVWEIWGALLYGGRLVVVSQATSRSPRDFYELLCREQVTVLNQTPSAFRQLVAAQAQSTQRHVLRSVIFGGEALECATLKPWFAQNPDAATQLVNMYGITETTVHVTYYPLTHADTERIGPSPIGVRIPDLRTYLLDEQRRPVPIGVTGELYVGGAGVARGYLNREALTAERFLADPFVAPADGIAPRMYKSGDLGRWRPDGGIEFLGRNDHQVKIRGFRIELGEIEARLLSCPGVREAVVLAREDGAAQRMLVAYVVAHDPDTSLNPRALRQALGGALPDYMVPSAFVLVEALPLTTNGKLDRNALPAPIARDFAAGAYEAPADELELSLARLFGECLQLEQIGRQDNFFDLGGDSLLLVDLQMRLEAMFSRKLHLDDVMAASTVARLARLIREGDAVDGVVTIRQGSSDATPVFFVHDGNGDVLVYRNLANLLDVKGIVYGLSPTRNPGLETVDTRIEAIAARYVSLIRRIQPQGPYLLSGMCTGGVIAVEVALQLERMGAAVDMLALIDAAEAHAEVRTGLHMRFESSRFAAALTRRASWAHPLATLGGALAFVGQMTGLVFDVIATRFLDSFGRFRAKLLRRCLDRRSPPPRWLLSLHVKHIYALAQSDYFPRAQLECDVMLLKATESNGEVEDTPFGAVVVDPLLGWRGRTRQPMRVFDLPGGHYSMMHMPKVKAVADVLQQRIDVVLRGARPA